MPSDWAGDVFLRYGRRLQALAAVDQLKKAHVPDDALEPIVKWIDANLPKPEVPAWW